MPYTISTHLNGILLHKVIHKAGVYPDVNSSRFTLAKDDLRKLCPVDKYRQFKLVAGKFEKVGVEKFKITPKEAVRS